MKSTYDIIEVLYFGICMWHMRRLKKKRPTGLNHLKWYHLRLETNSFLVYNHGLQYIADKHFRTKRIQETQHLEKHPLCLYPNISKDVCSSEKAFAFMTNTSDLEAPGINISTKY